MGVLRGLRIGLVAVAALALTAPASWASPKPTGQRYNVTFKLSGHYSWELDGQSGGQGKQTAVADWRYQERFGPVSLFAGGSHSARAHTPTVSGGWTETDDTAGAGGDCSRSGSFSLTSGTPALKVTPGFDGGDSIVMHGNAPETQYVPGDNCGYLIFDGCVQESVYAALKGHSNCTSALNTFNYFPVHLSVTKAGLRARHFTYHVSNAKNPGEQVDPHCNIGQNPSIPYTSACSYTWSGTVSFAPA
jgi:hypothetical protein